MFHPADELDVFRMLPKETIEVCNFSDEQKNINQKGVRNTLEKACLQM